MITSPQPEPCKGRDRGASAGRGRRWRCSRRSLWLALLNSAFGPSTYASKGPMRCKCLGRAARVTASWGLWCRLPFPKTCA